MTGPRVPVALAALMVAVSLMSLGHYPAIGGDDVNFSAPALHLITTGTLARTYARAGFEKFDCFPPLLPLAIAPLFKLAGFGVIPTVLPAWLFGFATAAILFTLGCQLGGLGAASIATVVFMLDPVTYETWVSGRYDSLFVLTVVAAILLSSYCARAKSGGALASLSLAAGVLIGLAGASYYPFSGIALAIGGIAMVSAIAEQSATRARTIAALAFAVGFLSVAGELFAFLYPHLDQCYAQMAGLSRDYLDPRIGWRNEAVRILSEWQRYEIYAVIELGLPNLMLGITGLWLIRRSSRNRWEWLTFGIAPVLFMIFLTAYGVKYRPRYLATAIALWCPGLALVEGQLMTNATLTRWRTAIKSLVSLAIAAGVIRMFLVIFTLAYQCQARDYIRFNREVRASIPPAVAVIGPQTVWYALATQDPDLWLYGHGYTTMNATTGEAAMNDPASLRDVEYVILSRWSNRLAGLNAYVRANFRLIKKIHPPFRPLPWARNPPLQVDIYERVPRGTLH